MPFDVLVLCDALAKNLGGAGLGDCGAAHEGGGWRRAGLAGWPAVDTARYVDIERMAWC